MVKMFVILEDVIFSFQWGKKEGAAISYKFCFLVLKFCPF